MKNETQIANANLKTFVGDVRRLVLAVPCDQNISSIRWDARGFQALYVVLINADEWEDEIKGKYFVRGYLVFFELCTAGEPTGKKIDAGAWEDKHACCDGAPVLNKFFHAQKSK